MILDKVIDVLSKIANNTGITSKNIKDAIATVMTSTNMAITTVNNANVPSNNSKKVSSSQYSESETRNRKIAQDIARGRFA